MKYLTLLLLVYVLIMSGCQKQVSAPQRSENSQATPKQTLAPETSSQEPEKNINGKIRAVGKTAIGDFKIIASGVEKDAILEVASCLGEATDHRLTGAYNVVYHDKHGQETLVTTLKNLEIITPDLSKEIKMKIGTIGDTDLAFFYPRFSDCHALVFYAFGIDKKTGKAFPVSFTTDQGTTDTYSTYVGALPKIVDQKMQITIGDFTSDFYNVTFRYDSVKHVFVQEKKELTTVEPRKIPREELNP